MSLPANRVGGVRGPGGTTLDDLLAALQGLGTSLESIDARLYQIFQQSATVNDTLGNPSQCDDGLTIVQLLCSVNTSVAGTTAPPAAPPVLCPGYEGGVSYGPVPFVQGTVNGLPTPQWFCDFSAAPDVFPFYPWPNTWSAAANGDDVYFWVLKGTVGQQLQVCVTLEVDGNDTGVELVRLNSDNTEMVQVSSWTGYNATGASSHSFIMTAPTKYALHCTTVGGAASTNRAWITIAPLG